MTRPWTPERLALLRAGFPVRPDADRLLAEINALPGPKIERQGLNAKAHVLGMKRDPAVRAEILRTSGREGNAKRVMIGGALTKRTAERVALIRAEWPTCRDRAALLERVNALPGDPIASVKALQRTARALGLRMDDETAWLAMSEGGRRGRAKGPPRVRHGRGGGMTRPYVRRWSEDRLALLRAEGPTCINTRDLLDRINAMGGPPIQNLKVMRDKMKALGISRTDGVLRQILSDAARRRNRSVVRGAARTAERQAVMLADYASTPNAVLLDRLNALPGNPIRRVASLCEWASELGLRKTLHACVRPKVARGGHAVAVGTPPDVESLTLAQQAAMADAAMERRLERAREMLRRKKDAVAIASSTRLPLREVFRLSGELRRERAAG